MANRIGERILAIEGTEIPRGDLDITLYRDDWTRIAHQPIVQKTEVPFSLDKKQVILVDDVLFTGRTIRAAMDALMDFGRPSRNELAILVDRVHRELPIQAVYKGTSINTDHTDMIHVHVKEHDNEDSVYIEQD